MINKLILIAFRGALNMINTKISKQSQPSTSEEFVSNPKTLIVARRIGLLKSVLGQLGVKLDKTFINQRMLELHLKLFEGPDCELDFENLDTYHRLYIYRHLMKCGEQVKTIFGMFDNLLSVKITQKQILYHKSYSRFRSQLLYLIHCKMPE